MEDFQEFGRRAMAYFEECDRIVAAEQERLLGVLLEYLDVPSGDYKAGLLRLAERSVPAFKMAEKRGPPPDFHGELRFLAAVENIKREKNLKDTAALQMLEPDLKKAKSRAKLKTRKNRLAKARRLFRAPAAGRTA
jgi:hypothetical protein